MKLLKYHEEQCGNPVILTLTDAIGALPEFFANSDAGDKLHIEVIELSEEEYDNLPEWFGC